jgi:sugar transferase EpsL
MYDAIKRAMDVLVSLALLVLLSPVIAGSAICVRLFMGRPILFRQTRPGLHGRPFRLLKFRTMTDMRSPTGEILPDEERLNGFGRFMRCWSLDELPQLWNVLSGDLSLVGPRPLLMQYLDRYTPEQMQRHDVKPGITGWAQVNGRNCISWEEKFAYDLWYVDHRSLYLDMKILWLTARTALFDRTSSPKGADTMPEFMGDRLGK